MSETKHWPVRAEIECAMNIVEAMGQDIRDIEAAIPSSKRGTRFTRAFDSLKARVETAKTCLADALRKEKENA